MKNWVKRTNATSLQEVIRNHLTEEEQNNTNPIPVKNIDKAAVAVKKSLDYDTVYCIGDYDVDGIMSSGIIYFMYQILGKQIHVRIPRRFSEGYGLSEKIIDEIPAGSFIITVDNGIAAKKAIEKAKEKGCFVLLTDHHLAPADDDGKMILPDTDVIVDPAIEEDAFKGFCGAMLAYKLAEKVLGQEHPSMQMLQSMAGIATVADVMPLIYENRKVVKETLNTLELRKSTLGINTLLDILGMERITETDIGYQIAPIFNASGRMYDDGAMRIFNLVTSSSPDDLSIMVEDAIEVNRERKELQNEYIRDIKQTLEEENRTNDFPLVVYKEDVPEGLLGIIAGNLAETYKTPAIMLSDSKEEGILKGSGRTFGSVNLKKLLDSCKNDLYKYGGHAGAAGLSLLTENFEIFRENMKKELKKTGQKQDRNDYYDLEITASEIPVILRELQNYAPFGEHNPIPIFKIVDFKLKPNSRNGGFCFLMGKNGEHLKLSGEYADALDFHTSLSVDKNDVPMKWELYGTLNYNYYRNVCSCQVLMEDGIPEKKQETDLMAMLFAAGQNRF